VKRRNVIDVSYVLGIQHNPVSATLLLLFASQGTDGTG